MGPYLEGKGIMVLYIRYIQYGIFYAICTGLQPPVNTWNERNRRAT